MVLAGVFTRLHASGPVESGPVPSGGLPDIIISRVEGATMGKTKKRDRKQRQMIDAPSF